jgi:hypothetical protein
MFATSAVDTRDGRWLAASGLLFVAAWIVGLVIVSPPEISAPVANLISFYQANTGLVMWQAYLANGLTGMLLLVFVAALHSVLRRHEGQSSVLSSLLLGAGIVVVSLSCLEALFMLTLSHLVTVTQDGAVIRTLLDLNTDIDTFKLPLLGIMIAATSLLGWRVKAAPNWLAWVGAVEATLLVIATGSAMFPGAILTSVLYASGIGLLAWTAAVSVVMGLLHMRTAEVKSTQVAPVAQATSESAVRA